MTCLCGDLEGKQDLFGDFFCIDQNSLGKYLQEHLTEEVSLSVLAEQYYLNAQYISQLFKNEIGEGF